MTPYWEEDEPTWEGAIFDAWADALFTAYSLKRAERAREIRGDRSFKGFHRNIHTFSAEWGKVLLCEELLPGLSMLRFCGGELQSWHLASLAAVEANEQAARAMREGDLEWA